jgi:hypothetical protein
MDWVFKYSGLRFVFKGLMQILFSNNTTDIQEVFNSFNSLSPTLKFTMEMENNDQIKTTNSAPSDSMHSLVSICSQFLPE